MHGSTSSLSTWMANEVASQSFGLAPAPAEGQGPELAAQQVVFTLSFNSARIRSGDRSRDVRERRPRHRGGTHGSGQHGGSLFEPAWRSNSRTRTACMWL